MQLSTYKPNFNSAPFKKRALKVIKFCSLYVHNNEYSDIHSSKIRKHFGNVNDKDKPMLTWFKNQLLISGRGHLKGSHSINYKINTEKFNWLEHLLLVENVITTPVVISSFAEKFNEELAGKKQFEYLDKSYRLWNSMQFVPSVQRDQLFEGWSNYDIDAALPTMFYQTHLKYSSSELMYIKQFIENKRSIRKLIADEIEIDISLAKDILTALFLGAKLNNFEKCGIYKTIRKNLFNLDKVVNSIEIQNKIKKLQQLEFIQGLLSDIKEFWKTTHPKFNLARKEQNLQPITKNLLYFYFEREVLNVIIDYCETHQIPLFCEHDGFRTRIPIAIDEIQKLVLDKTGFKLTWS